MTTAPSSPFDATRSGLYRTPDAIDLLQQAAARLGIAYFGVELGGARDKDAFLAACARALGFPATFGHNWDAFADSVQDLSWRPARGYLVHLEHVAAFARSAPESYATAIEILRYAADDWKARGTAFIVLVDDAPDLPDFSA